mmetsp:Transcript_33639/g.77658  ORF Transcript_33639/g.77658 Transcript_33639/m.77658 type:complete len:166 (-) Transcript_33639:110-607(-)
MEKAADILTDVSTSQVRPEVPGADTDPTKLDDVMEADLHEPAVRSRTAMLPHPEDDMTGSNSLKPSRTAMMLGPEAPEIEQAVRSRTAMLPGGPGGSEEDDEEVEHAVRSRTAMWPLAPEEDPGKPRPSRTAMVLGDETPSPEASTESSRFRRLMNVFKKDSNKE